MRPRRGSAQRIRGRPPRWYPLHGVRGDRLIEGWRGCSVRSRNIACAWRASRWSDSHYHRQSLQLQGGLGCGLSYTLEALPSTILRSEAADPRWQCLSTTCARREHAGRFLDQVDPTSEAREIDPLRHQCAWPDAQRGRVSYRQRIVRGTLQYAVLATNAACMRCCELRLAQRRGCWVI